MTDLTPLQISRLAMAAKAAMPVTDAKVSISGRSTAEWTIYLGLCDPSTVLALCEIARRLMPHIDGWPCECGQIYGHTFGHQPATFEQVVKGAT